MVAAEAIGQALQILAPDLQVTVKDPFSEAIDVLPGIMEGMQAASIRIAPALYDGLWRRGGTGSLYDHLADLGFLADMLLEQLEDSAESYVIATHVLPCALSASLKRQTTQIKRVYGVATDFGLHQLWPLSGVDGYYVAHSELGNLFTYRGLNPELICSTGIPIRTEFVNKLSQDVAVREEGKLRVLLLAGGFFGGGYAEIRQLVFDFLDSLDHSAIADRIEISIITGKQEKFTRNLIEFVQGLNHKPQILGFVKDIHRVMRAHDLIITKPGGLISSESLACGLGMILLKPGPGQETANEEFLARHGVALRGSTSKEILNALEKCLYHPETLAGLQTNSRSLGVADSAFRLARDFLGKNGYDQL